MKSGWAIGCFYAAIVISVGAENTAQALGLSKIVADSRLFQPLYAEISLTGVDATDINAMQVRFGTSGEYLQLGKQRPAFLQQITLAAQLNDSGKPVIKLHSVRSLDEPVLDFLIAVTTPQGQVLKTFQLLLDPPDWRTDAAVSTPAQQNPLATAVRVDVPTTEAEVIVQPSTRETLIEAGLIKGEYYGPVRDGDRLSLIAQRTRHDRSVTINQMMLAYVRLNPQAFERGNLSGLRQGEVLRIPSHARASELSRAAASVQVSRHFRAWESGVALVAQKTAAELPEVASTTVESALKILPAERESLANSAADHVPEGTADAVTSSHVLQRELAHFKTQLDDIRRLLTLKEAQIISAEREARGKDAELAALRQLLVLRTEQSQQLSQQLALLSNNPSEPVMADKTLFSLILALLIGLPGIAGLGWYAYRQRARLRATPAAAAGWHAETAMPVSTVSPSTDERAHSLANVPLVPTGRVTLPSVAHTNLEPVLHSKNHIDSEQPCKSEPDARLATTCKTNFIPEGDNSDSVSAEHDSVLDEVEVYLAYGLYQQSETLLSATIESHPEKDSYRVKLLETLLLAAKYEEFEARARQFKANIDEQQWAMIKRYATDSGIRPSFFDEDARDFTDWIDEYSGDIEFELDTQHTTETSNVADAENSWSRTERLKLDDSELPASRSAEG